MYTLANIRPFGHNVGNTAISFALKNMLQEVFGRVVSIVEYPATSKYDSSRAGLTSSVVHDINRYCDGVIVGGGNLYENDELDIDQVALNNLQPPLMLFSNSRGRVYDRYGRLSERTDVISDAKLSMLVDKAAISLSRDTATHRYIHNLGFPKDELGWCPTANTGGYLDQLPTLHSGEYVGALISVRTPNLMNLPYHLQNNVYTVIGNTIDQLRQSGYERVRLLCNDSRDLDFATSFRYNKNIDTVYTADVYQYLALLRDASLVVSYRLHATLPAISMGTPTVNISYDERSASLFNDLGMSDQFLDYVNLGGQFQEKLFDQLSRVDKISESQKNLAKNWGRVGRFQRGSIAKFKSHVDEYLLLGREMLNR